MTATLEPLKADSLLPQQTQNGVDITEVVRVSLQEIIRLQRDIDGAGVPMTKATKQEVFNSLETLKVHIGLKGLTEAAFVGVINALREQGILLQEICRHNQLTPRFLQPIQSDLPFDLAAARGRMALARHLKSPVTSFAEASDVYRQVLEGIELLTKGDDGDDGGVSLMLDKVTTFLKRMKCFKQDLQKAYRAVPLEEFSRTRLVDFLDATSWVVVEHNRAAEIKRRKDQAEARA